MTIAKLHPTGLSTIDLVATDSKGFSYGINLATLDLHESDRLEIAYSEGANVEGGQAISSRGPLVPITFDVPVQGSGVDEDAAKQQLLQRVQALKAALCNSKGGTFEYKPAGLGAGVRSTFYHYVQSQPPKPRAAARNNWDTAPLDKEPSYVCAIQLEVELQTQPFATSDPDSPIAVQTATTIYNQDDGTTGHVAVAAENIKGTIPALVQLHIRNMVSGAWAAIGKLWYARRTEGTLSNFSPVLEGGTADADSSIHWSTVSDNTRRSDNYLRYAPPQAANGQWAYRYYPISNIADHEGKAAVAVVCRSLAEGREDWDLKAALKVADVVVETRIKNVSVTGMWTVLILGELDIPPTPMSDDEIYATDLYVYFRRNTGSEAIDIDFVQLLYVDEYPQQVTVTDGFTNAYKLLMENFSRELCHVVDATTLAFEKAATAFCPLLKLRPGIANRLDLIWERLHEVALDDNFGNYEAWNWLPIGGFETGEGWTISGYGGSFDTALYVEGVRGVELYAQSTETSRVTLEGSWDFSVEGRFTDDDFVYIAAYRNDTKGSGQSPTLVSIRFVTSEVGYYQKEIQGDLIGDTWAFLKYKKSSFTTSGSPDWANITKIRVLLMHNGSQVYVTFDDLRVAKADPSDATKGNDTGDVWDFMRDVWHIEEQGSTYKNLGCIDKTASLEQVALIHEDPPTDIKYLAYVAAKRDDGEVGLVFRCADGTSGSEDMAAFFIDTTNDKLELRKWAAGSASDIATAVDQSLAPDWSYWLGVWLVEGRIRCYYGTAEADIWDDENKEFVASARKFDMTDSDFASGGALASGQCGLLSIGTLGRFTNVQLYAVGGGHVPGDTVQVEVKAVYRTIFPFRE